MKTSTEKKCCVWVTRPEPSGPQLCQQLQALGFETVYVPAIVFAKPDESDRLMDQVRALEGWEWLIFISPQAVLASAEMIKAQWPHFPASVKIAAVGVGTAQTLISHGLPVTIYPTDEWSSAGLVALPVFQQVKEARIAIVKGEGGRAFLAEELTARGAIVDEWITYKRCLPRVDTTHLVSLLRQKAVDVIICTSGESLINIKNLLQSEWDLLQDVSLIVISPRLEGMAKEAGWKNVLLAKNASHQAVIEVLNKGEGVKMSDNIPETPTTNESSEPSTDISESSQSSAVCTRKKSCCWLTAAILVLVLAAIGAALMYLCHQNTLLQEHFNASEEKLANAVAQTTTLGGQVNSLTQQTEDLHKASQQQTQQLSELRNAQLDRKSGWVVAEAHYLTKLANDNLSVGDSIPSVIKLLQSADNALRDLNDTQLTPVRKALATDILALQNVPEIDVSGLYLKLSALNAEIDTLSLPNHRLTQNTDTKLAPAELSWWRRGLLQSQEMLRHIVTVRYRASSELPFIAPEAQDFLYQNIHAELNMAMWGLIHKQPAIYQKSLEQAAVWIKRYFLADAPQTITLLSNLAVLETVNIQPDLPTLNASLEAFQHYLASTDKPQAATTVAASPVS